MAPSPVPPESDKQLQSEKQLQSTKSESRLDIHTAAATASKTESLRQEFYFIPNQFPKNLILSTDVDPDWLYPDQQNLMNPDPGQ